MAYCSTMLTGQVSTSQLALELRRPRQRVLKKKRAIPAYGVFMMKNKKNPILVAAKSIPERGRKTAALYRKLTDAEKKALAAEGKKGRK